jgi:hypothetical protein
MSKGGAKKKEEGSEDKELKKALEVDIEILENKIYLEQEKELLARKELENILKELSDEQKKIEEMKTEEGKKINIESDSMRGLINNFTSQINFLEKSIRESDEEIKRYEKIIQEKSEQNLHELEEKDNLINEQRKLFEDMSIRFQHILQRTANKLQERVNMGA